MVTKMLKSLAICALFAPPLWADETDEPVAEPRQRSVVRQPAEIGSGIEARKLPKQALQSVKAAHAKSKTASTIADYTEILELCETSRDSINDASVEKYVNELYAWAANRRGEAYSQEAARLTAAKQLSKAAAQDRQALADFDAAVMADPTKWKALHNRGVSYALVGRYEEALADLTRSLELNGTYANTWFNRGEVRYELGQYEDAVADYDEVLSRKPDDVGALTGRGHAWFRMGKFTEALADYQKVATADAKNAGALVNRGDTYRQLGQWSKAATDYRAALKLDRKHGRAHRASAWLMATCPDERFRQTEQALASAEQAVQLNGGEDYLDHDTHAAALANAGQFAEAITAAKQALKLAPEDARLGIEERIALYRDGKPYRLVTHVALRPMAKR